MPWKEKYCEGTYDKFHTSKSLWCSVASDKKSKPQVITIYTPLKEKLKTLEIQSQEHVSCLNDEWLLIRSSHSREITGAIGIKTKEKISLDHLNLDKSNIVVNNDYLFQIKFFIDGKMTIRKFYLPSFSCEEKSATFEDPAFHHWFCDFGVNDSMLGVLGRVYDEKGFLKFRLDFFQISTLEWSKSYHFNAPFDNVVRLSMSNSLCAIYCGNRYTNLNHLFVISVESGKLLVDYENPYLCESKMFRDGLLFRNFVASDINFANLLVGV